MGIEKYIISLKDEPNYNVFDPRWLEDGTNSILQNENCSPFTFRLRPFSDRTRPIQTLLIRQGI